MSYVADPIAAVEAEIRVDQGNMRAWRVYADWLLDHGDPRGELIGLERLAERTENPALRDEIAALTAEHRKSWEPATLPVKTEYQWRYGFIVAVFIRDIFEPRQVRSLERLLSDPQARLLNRLVLGFRNHLKPAELYAPLAELDFGKLRRFDTSNLDGDEFVHALVQQTSSRVTELHLPHNEITNVGASDLANCAQLRGLRVLDLRDNAIGPEGVEALVNTPMLSELEGLDLKGNDIGVAGARALAESPFLTRMKYLSVDLDEQGKQALSSSFVLNPWGRDWERRR